MRNGKAKKIAPAKQTAGVVPASRHDRKSVAIFVIDDPNSIAQLTRQLEQCGYHVVLSPSADIGSLSPGYTISENGNVRIDIQGRSVEVDGKEIYLPRKEFEIVAHLVKRVGEIVPREELISAIWENPTRGTGRSLDVHIARVRRKLARYRDIIVTMKRVGYRFNM